MIFFNKNHHLRLFFFPTNCQPSCLISYQRRSLPALSPTWMGARGFAPSCPGTLLPVPRPHALSSPHPHLLSSPLSPPGEGYLHTFLSSVSSKGLRSQRDKTALRSLPGSRGALKITRVVVFRTCKDPCLTCRHHSTTRKLAQHTLPARLRMGPPLLRLSFPIFKQRQI